MALASRQSASASPALAVALLLAALCLAGAAAQQIGTFWQLTDIHYDPQYKTGGDPLQRCVVVDGSAGKAGVWGDYSCDTTNSTFHSVLQLMKTVEPTPDFIVFTGDSVPHYLSYNSMERYTPEMVQGDVEYVAQTVRRYFPAPIPIYPTFGNHDCFPSDQLPLPGQSAEGTQWLQWTADTWREYYTLQEEAAYQSTVRAGYSVQRVEPGLLLVNLNTVYWDVLNVWVYLQNKTDLAGQMTWLEQVLQQAESDGDRVWLVGHRTPGPDDSAITPHTWNEVTAEYTAIVNRYNQTITGQFYGHEHQDSFRVFRDQATNTVPIGVMYITPSQTTFTNQNPTVRLFQYDKQTKMPLDMLTYWANMSAANANPARGLQWSLEYSARKAYGMPDLSPASWWAVVEQLNASLPMWHQFTQYFTAGAQPDDACDSQDCYRLRICAIANPDYRLFLQCLGDL